MKLSHQISIVVFGIIAVFIAMGIALNNWYARIQTEKNLVATTGSLIASFRSDGDQIMANMILQQTDGLRLYLEQMKLRDQLLEAVIVTDRQFEAETSAKPCLAMFRDSDTCIESNGRRYVLYNRLRYGNVELGYLKRVYAVAGEKLFTPMHMRYLAIIFIPLIVAIFIAVSRVLNRMVVKPLRELCDSIQPLKRGKFDIRISSPKSHELRVLIQNIDMILRELRRHQEERALIEEGRRKQETSAALAEAAAQVAHDMRSPLSVLKAYLGSAAPKREDDVECAAAAERSVNKLLHMADDLVDYAKASKIDRSRRSRLKEMLENAIAEVRNKAEEKGVSVGYHMDTAFCVDADEYRMERVFVNLADNAIQACDRGGSVTIEASAERDTSLVIRVSDDGRGIAPEYRQRIFDSFFTKNKKGGTGLGLSYCKQVVEAHGGTIEVMSEVGSGSTFTIRIPDCIVSDADARMDVDEPNINCAGRKFVLIDDNSDIRLRWRRIVEQSGGKVLCEADSYESLVKNEGLNVDDADVAIVDYNYDGSCKTGIDVISYLKKRGLEDIYLCTGHAGDADICRAALAAGAVSVIMKE